MEMNNRTADEQESTNRKLLLSGDVSARIPDNNNKKTRDLPNLSECQACGFRIDSCSSTGNNKIQILYSEWRIVLLCNKCHYRVESSQICSYCFKETSRDFFLTCCQCKRCVHRNCFLKCKSFAPWSYSSCSMEFSICVDCWLPKSMMKRQGLLSLGKNGTNCANLGNSNSRVLNGGGNCVVERKIVVALRARGMVERKAVVKERAIEMESKALHMGLKRDAGGENGKKVAVDDAELAFQLHRTMNSSPRISKNLCAVDSSCSRVPKKRGFDGALVLGGSDSGNPSVCLDLEVCIDKKLKESTDRSFLDTFISVNSEDLAVRLKEGEGSCSNNMLKSSGDETSTNFDSRSSHNNQYESTSYKVEICNGKPDRFLLKYRKRSSSFKPLLHNKSKVEICNGNLDRFLLKYRKRNSSSKPVMDNKSKVEIHNEKRDRYLLKYRKRNTSSKQVQDDRSKILYEILSSPAAQ